MKYKNRVTYLINKIEHWYSKRKIEKYDKEIPIIEIKKEFTNLNDEYNYFHHFFWNRLPFSLRKHRSYFSKEMRGFGEDAFHSMWYLLIKETKPKNILEIGVYRGQTLSLFQMICNEINHNAEIHGISPFTNAGDNVSEYLTGLEYYNDVLENFNYFKLKHPILHVGYSNDESMKTIYSSKKWDLIYIDGNHDYDVAKYDFKISAENLRKSGFIILDDASLYTKYSPKSYSTAGHPGPSKLALEINQNEFREILSVGHNRIYQKII